MSTFPNTPKLNEVGLFIDAAVTVGMLRIIALQANSDPLTQQIAKLNDQDRVEPAHFNGSAVDTLKLEADIDATDHLGLPLQNPKAGQQVIQPQRTALELLVKPSSA